MYDVLPLPKGVTGHYLNSLIKSFFDVFITISRRLELLKGLKDPYPFLHDLAYVSYQEFQTHLLSFVLMCFSLFKVILKER